MDQVEVRAAIRKAKIVSVTVTGTDAVFYVRVSKAEALRLAAEAGDQLLWIQDGRENEFLYVSAFQGS